jgi:hypothetical protein
MPRLFDAYIAVDWSSRSNPSPAGPSKDAIWVGERLAQSEVDASVVGEAYFRTRLDFKTHVRNRLLQHADHRRRVLIGFDFAYGYPEGYVDALGMDVDLPPWRRVWNEPTELVTDNARNLNNRFEAAAELNARRGEPTLGPFWGCPLGRQRPTLKMTSPVYPYTTRSGLTLDRLRQVDKRQRGAQEIWKLFGAGSVGGQSLVGIPVVRGLRDDTRLAAFSRVWPFETGFVSSPVPDEGPFVLHVEIFPGNVLDQLDADLAVRDQAQVRAVTNWLSRLDSDGQLRRLFATPGGLSPEEIDACVEEEGWIIGS